MDRSNLAGAHLVEYRLRLDLETFGVFSSRWGSTDTKARQMGGGGGDFVLKECQRAPGAFKMAPGAAFPQETLPAEFREVWRVFLSPGLHRHKSTATGGGGGTFV